MSKKFKIGEIIGIILGVTLGAFTVHYVHYKIFGPKEQPYAQQGNYGVGQPQFNQTVGQPGVFEQALSAPSSNAQNRVY